MESGHKLGKRLGPMWSSPSMLDYQVPLGDPRRDEATAVVVLEMLWEARPWRHDRSWARGLGPCGAHQACEITRYLSEILEEMKPQKF